MIRNAKDFCAGLMFVAFGVAALVIGWDYAMGTAARMGPGYFPFVLGLIMIALGGAIALIAIRGEQHPVPRFAIRPMVVISIAVALFGLAINILGLVATVILLTVVGRLAGPGHGWVETAILAVALAAIAAGIFHYGLGMQFPLWPQIGG